MKFENMKTTIFGLIGGTSFTTAVAALASPEVNTALKDAGVSPIWLIVIGGIAKMIRDIYAKDANKKVAVGEAE